MSTGQLARDVIRAEKLPICEVCGDRREPKGSAFAAHVKGIHHRANAVLTRRALAGWCPMTPELLSVLKSSGIAYELDGHWSDVDKYRRSHREEIAFVSVDTLVSFVEDPGTEALAYAIEAGWGPWMLKAQRFVVATSLPWWVAVRVTDPATMRRWDGDISLFANVPINMVRGRPWPRPWFPAAWFSHAQRELSLAGGVQ